MYENPTAKKLLYSDWSWNKWSEIACIKPKTMVKITPKSKPKMGNFKSIPFFGSNEKMIGKMIKDNLFSIYRFASTWFSVNKTPTK